MSDLGRTAIITGGASGIGAAVVERLRKRSVRPVIFDQTDGRETVRVDVAQDDQCRTAVQAVGRVDILVNCAGISDRPGAFSTRPLAVIERVIEVNLNGTMNMCRHVLPKMVELGWGRIVNVASGAGKDGPSDLAAYSASKAGVIGFTKSLGKESARSGVLVNAVTPGMTDTPLLRKGKSPEMLTRMVESIPLGRLAQPDEIASIIDWLTSDQCTYSTGAVFDASGGRATY